MLEQATGTIFTHVYMYTLVTVRVNSNNTSLTCARAIHRDYSHLHTCTHWVPGVTTLSTVRTYSLNSVPANLSSSRRLPSPSSSTRPRSRAGGSSWVGPPGYRQVFFCFFLLGVGMMSSRWGHTP